MRESHGYCGTRTYRIWKAMRNRCNNPNAHRFHRYGGRGVRVDPRWDSFSAFLADMGEAPEGKSLDRWPDRDGDYRVDNCRWATPQEQGRNTSQNRMVTHDGETLGLSVWAERLGVTTSTLWKRLHRHGSIYGQS